jgi:hypothetical protein
MDNKILIIGHHINFPPGNRKLRECLIDYLTGVGYDISVIESNSKIKNMKIEIGKYKKIINFEETFDDRSMERFGIKKLEEIYNIFEGKNIFPNLKFSYYTDSKMYYKDLDKKYLLPYSQYILNFGRDELKKKVSKCMKINGHIVVKFGFSGEKHGYYEFTETHENYFQRNEWGDATNTLTEMKYEGNPIDSITDKIILYGSEYKKIIGCDLPILIQPYNIHITDRNNERRCLIFNGEIAERFAKGKGYDYEKFEKTNPEHIEIMKIANYVWEFMKNKFPNDCLFIRADIGFYLKNDTKKFYINEIEGFDATMYFSDNPKNKSWYETLYYQELLAGIIVKKVMLWGGNTIDMPKKYPKNIETLFDNEYFAIEKNKISPLDEKSLLITSNDIFPNYLSSTWKINSIQIYFHNDFSDAYLYYMKNGLIGSGDETMNFVKNVAKNYGYKRIILKDGAKSYRNYSISLHNYLIGKNPFYVKYGFKPMFYIGFMTIPDDFLTKLMIQTDKIPGVIDINKIIKYHAQVNGLLKCLERILMYVNMHKITPIYFKSPKNISENLQWVRDSCNIILNNNLKYIQKIFIDFMASMQVPYAVKIGNKKIGLFNVDMWKIKQYSYFLKNAYWVCDISG